MAIKRKPSGELPSTPKATKQRQFEPNVFQQFQGDSHTDSPSGPVPDIVVHESSGGESAVSPPEALSAPIRLRSSDESSLGDGRDLNLKDLQLEPWDESEHRPEPTQGFIFPPTISYTLHITFEDGVLEPTATQTVPANDVDSYHKIEKLAEQLVRENFKGTLASRELNFRHGSCKIISEQGREDIHPLSSQDDWKDVCFALFNYWTSQSHHNIRLDISRDYFALQTEVLGSESFSITKRREINSLMKRSSSGRHYIPRIDLMRMTSIDSIRQIILQDDSLSISHQEKEEFILDVQKRAGKLLAMCVLAPLKMKCLKKLMDGGLSDRSLPLREESCCHQKCSADFRNLFREQGGFMAPEFNEIGEYKALHPCCVIPMHFYPKDRVPGSTTEETENGNGSGSQSENGDDAEKDNACCGFGAFSKVYRVRIHPDYHKLSRDRDSDFALKEFNDRPLRAGADFRQETRILNELRKYSHKHIVIHLASWTQGEKDYMLFPYAQCNLREYMKQTSFNIKDKECLLWLLEQLLGLADALRNLHNFADPQNSGPSSTLAAAHPEVRKSGWHHDIKPENILYYRDIGAKHGILKMADFGSGKVHIYRSGSVNTRSPNGTLTYEPPEAKYENATSRPYDVWSLGCVLLELLIWAIFKIEEVESFAKAREARRFPDHPTDEFEDDAFWQMKEDDKFSRRDAVDCQIRNLRKEALNHEAQPFKEVVELIEPMLDPNRHTRITALYFWDTLNRIVEQKKVDLNYPQDKSWGRKVDTKNVPLPRLDLQVHIRSQR